MASGKVVLGTILASSLGGSCYGVLGPIGPQNIEDQIALERKIALDTESTDLLENKKWQLVIGKYPSKNQRLKSFAKWGEKYLSDSEKIKKLKESCRSIKSMSIKEKFYKRNLKNFRDYCVERKYMKREIDKLRALLEKKDSSLLFSSK